jgi:hypothetical protein
MGNLEGVSGSHGLVHTKLLPQRLERARRNWRRHGKESI